MLQTKGKQAQEVKELVDTAAIGVFQSVEQHGVEAVEDWEVDELLQWTNGLNFDRSVSFLPFFMVLCVKTEFSNNTGLSKID